MEAVSSYLMCAIGASMVGGPLRNVDTLILSAVISSSSTQLGSSASMSSSWNDLGLPRATLR